MSGEHDEPPIRPILPDDPEGRSWVQCKTATKFAPEQSAIPLLVALVEGKVEILGNCFVIYGHNNSALCLGAAHSFEPVAREQQNRKGQPALNVPADFAPIGPKFIDAGDVQAYIFVETGIVECRVDQLCYIDNYDIALFTIEAPKEYVFNGRTAIDLSVPAVGELVSVLGNFSTHQERDDKNVTGAFLRRFEARTGLVTEANLGPNRQRHAMSFETTIPFPSGLSGAPVLRGRLDAGKELVACGCVSFDISSEEAHTKFHHPGKSTAAMLWPTLGHALKMAIEQAAEKTCYLGEVQGHVVAAIEDLSVQLTRDGDMIELLHEDQRRVPPSRLSLRVTAHPDLKVVQPEIG